jgi:hypothetical protein
VEDSEEFHPLTRIMVDRRQGIRLSTLDGQFNTDGNGR